MKRQKTAGAFIAVWHGADFRQGDTVHRKGEGSAWCVLSELRGSWGG